MSGRKRQPLSVIQGKGRSNHITKSEARERKKQEEWAKGFDDKIEPPKYLLASQKKEFTRIADELLRLEIFSNLDVDALARYVDSKHEYEKVTRSLRKTRPTEDNIEMYSALRINRNTFYNECRAAASDLGLTITSRLKLVIPKVEEKEVSELERKFGDI